MNRTLPKPLIPSALLLAVLFCVAPSARANSPVSQDQIRTWIDQLDHRSYTVRERAQKSLIEAGQRTVNHLKDALASKKLVPEARTRLESALRTIRLNASDFGPPVEGLALRLATRTDTLRPGEQAELTVTIKNTSDHHIRTYTGMSYAGSRFQNGTALRLLNVNENETMTNARKPEWNVGFCGTGARRLFLQLNPGEKKTYTFGLRYRRHDEEKRILEIINNEWGRNISVHPYFSVPETGTVRLAVQHDVDEQHRQNSPTARPWTGNLTSGTVNIRLRSAGK